ncbi:ABC transporter permease [Actinomadura viridis]|uniref:ABC transporter permease n=1 Tax=Actinomadura viridis TaxID=58110 RepID=UPI00369A6C90
MARHAARRLLVAIPLVLVSTFVVFVLVSASGDPLARLKTQNPPPAPSVIRAEQARLGLDDPLPVRYWAWVSGLPRGDFGASVDPRLDIGAELGSRFTVTVRLVTLAILLALVLAVGAGVLGAVRRHTRPDHGITLLAFVLISMPSFWFAILLKQGAVAVNDAAGTTVLYTLGDASVGGGGLLDQARHLVLPTLALSLIAFGAWSRYQRSAMLDVLDSDYVLFARAKGLRWRRVVWRHALRNALVPLITVSALDLATILGGAVVIEQVFQWRGMGDFLVRSVQAHDVHAVASWLLLAGIVVVVANLIADLLCAALDPRIRYE